MIDSRKFARRASDHRLTMRIYGGAAALLGWFALALQFYLMIALAPHQGSAIASTIVTYFSFFTILTNLLVALVLSFSTWGRGGRRGRFFAKPGIQSATLVYITVVGVTYSLVLRQLWNPRGAQKLADVVLHDGMPVIYALYWILFVPKMGLRWKDAFGWLIYPGAYLVYLLIRGALVGVYPYPFVDVTTLGYPRMWANAVLFLFFFWGLGLLVIATGRWSARLTSRIKSGQFRPTSG
jgi:hypothetical protein